MATSFSVTVSLGKDTFSIETSSEETGKVLMEKIEEVTGVMMKKQKIIFKGKVVDAKSTMAGLKIQSGSKLMLLVTGGETRPQQKSQPSSKPAAKLPVVRKQVTTSTPPTGSLQERAKMWQKTGFVSVRDMQLSNLPDLSGIAGAVRVLDATNNQLAAMPPVLASLSNLQSIRLSHNELSTEASGQLDAASSCFARLSNLTTLVLDANRLDSLQFACQPVLAKLQVLSASRNAIAALPADIGCLQRLKLLNLSHNQLTGLPSAIGLLSALGELDASSNSLIALPSEMSSLKSLRVLQLENNRLKALPPAMLSECESLVTLTLHNNPISLEELRDAPGFADYNQRRIAKCDKQMEMSVMLDVERSFDEGADVTLWEHFSKFNK